MTTIRIATTNIKHSEQRGEMAAAIKQVRGLLPKPPNVWAGQETNGATKEEWNQALGPSWSSVKRGVVDGFFNGTAVGWDTTDFRVKARGVEVIYEPPKDGPYERYEGQEKKDWRRFATWATLHNDKVGTFSSVSVHGKLGTAAKTKQATNLLALLKRLEKAGPVVVAGDFNDSTVVVAILQKAGYTIVQRATIDIIFAKGFERVDGRTIPKPQTVPHMDHPAVYAELKIKKVKPQPPSKSFRVGSFNILGATHTDPKNGEHYSKKYKPWDERIGDQVRLMLESKCSVFGLQECQGPQLAALKRMMPTWRARTGTGTRDNVVFWDDKEWDFQSVEQVTIHYFGGAKKTMPSVVLKNRITGELEGFLNVHNPANARGDATEWRAKDVRIETAYLKGQTINFTWLGDMNSGPPFQTQVKRLLPEWKIAAKAAIDYVLCPDEVRVREAKVDRRPQTLKASDHPLVWAELEPK